jgi:hypothetical protein
VTVDDSRIDEIRRAVLGRLGGSSEERPGGSLEARVSALESAVAALQRGGPAVVPVASAPPRGHTHPSLVVVSLPSDADLGPSAPGRCVMEPDKPCVHSGACRTFGH